MQHSISINRGDEIAYFEDWGQPAGIRVGDLTIRVTDTEAIASLSSALFALELELAAHRDKVRHEWADAVETGDYSNLPEDGFA